MLKEPERQGYKTIKVSSAITTSSSDSYSQHLLISETDIREPYDGPEIVEQTALDHFNAILQKAQRLAAEAEKEKP
jgi:hypothetical protein